MADPCPITTRKTSGAAEDDCYPEAVAAQARSMYRLVSKLSRGEQQPTIREIGARFQELGFRGDMVTKALQRAQQSNAEGDGDGMPTTENDFVRYFGSMFWSRGEGDVVLFAAHDPGAVSHTHPLYAAAVAEGRAAVFMPLREGRAWIGPPRAKEVLDVARTLGNVCLVVLGCSTCRAELDVVTECEEDGIPTVSVVDWMPSYRFDTPGDEVFHFPDRFIVVDDAAKAELRERYEVERGLIDVVGSPALEAIAHSPASDYDSATVKQMYGLRGAQRLLTFFPGTMDGPGAAQAIPTVLSELATSFPSEGWLVVVRTHPRITPGVLKRLLQACTDHGFFLDHKCYCSGSPMSDNVSLLRASDASLSVGSSMSLESLALGTPSAFFYGGLPDNGEHRESFVRSLPVLRIHNAAQAAGFLTFALHWDNSGRPADVACCMGASSRAWAAAKKLLVGKNNHQRTDDSGGRSSGTATEVQDETCVGAVTGIQ